jgi:RTX calcium-binding nonapeptide repeat (4 copies)
VLLSKFWPHPIRGATMLGITITLLLFSGLLPMMNMASAAFFRFASDDDDDDDTETLSESELGITDLDTLGDKIEDLNLPPGSIRFDNEIICKAATTCLGTDDDDIIFAGAASLVFGLKGDDIIFGALGDHIFGNGGDDLILAGPGNTLIDGGRGDDVLKGGLGRTLAVGGPGDDKILSGAGTTVMAGRGGVNTFDCRGVLATTIVLDFQPENGDIQTGRCTIINPAKAEEGALPGLTLPDTGELPSEVPPNIGGSETEAGQ